MTSVILQGGGPIDGKQFTLADGAHEVLCYTLGAPTGEMFDPGLHAAFEPVPVYRHRYESTGRITPCCGLHVFRYAGSRLRS